MIVCGLNYGDEGKGLTTSYLCAITKNPIVVRFNGGHQAGHTVVNGTMRHVFSSFGSGTLQGVPTYWSKYCTFYPTAFENERLLLNEPIFYINPLCQVVTPYDVEANIKSSNYIKNGTVGVGFGTTIQRSADHYNLYVQDLFCEEVFHAKLANIKEYYHSSISNITSYLKTVKRILSKIIVVEDEIISKFTPIFEGAQGILLDQDFGFFPNVTRSNTTSKNALLISESTNIYYVTRSYLTRHGHGFMGSISPITIINNELETNVSDGYQGLFRTSKLNIELINYAIKCDNYFSKHLIKNLIITCNDQVSINITKLLDNIDYTFNHVYLSYGNSLEYIIKLY